MTYLDTHVVVWLAGGMADRLSDRARLVIGAADLSISPTVCDLGFEEVVIMARRQKWTRDPFDRIIAAQAAVRNAPLLTKDRTILANYPHALWD